MNFPLPQIKPISALAFTLSLLKLDKTIFKVLNNLSENDDSMFAAIKVNFKNCLATASKYLEEIMFVSANYVKDVIKQIVDSISRYRQKIQRNWSYLRKSGMVPYAVIYTSYLWELYLRFYQCLLAGWKDDSKSNKTIMLSS